ncbi:hypothetical protein SOM11_04480 [Frigoribacterium sp. CFBP9039]|uniref:hypothetical protein n=1 Tax=Frigoribacterium sp. CFBP9029 TaxID=3096541 RepID=UPI002A6B3FAF|nr:hypothetical protein [Frigoribacterium sp. CFBP9039]MDY0945238.1 hypothetical protein [Frigoribacterium sp. CFBP9039]
MSITHPNDDRLRDETSHERASHERASHERSSYDRALDEEAQAGLATEAHLERSASRREQTREGGRPSDGTGL